jgi:hypothetical protein
MGAKHTPGLWRNLGLSRLERVKAHRDEFGSSLKAAIEAVDEDYGRQAVTGRARLSDAASDLLEALGSLYALADGQKSYPAGSYGEAVMAHAKAAIRKATGEAA